MKKINLSILFLAIALCGFAKPIDVTKALNIAQEFCQQQSRITTRTKAASLSLAYQCTDSNIKSRAAGADVYYYIFNKTDNQGFIIIAGDDRAKAVLGYSDNGDYPLTNQPENFKAWMKAYEEAIKTLMASPENRLPAIKEIAANTKSSVAPLLGQIAWNQGDPYNLMCPMDGTKRSVTGCLATAIAQIMGYHRWPEKGIGSNTYTTETEKIKVSADFSQSTYDWNNITPTYNESSTTAQKDAIALLMRDCGIAFSMDYTSDGSGAYDINAATALINNFGYDKNLQLYNREYYTSVEWIAMIKEELNKSFPVYYGGISSGGGHAFVCDGYDTNNLFHINWGWGGVSNGYFELNTLNPGTQGIGGGLGGYNFYQSIFKGIQKPTNTSRPSYLVSQTSSMTTTATTIGKGTQFTVCYGVRNQGINTISPYFGFALYQNDTFVNILNSTSFNEPLKYGYGNDNINLKLTINSSVANGNYQLRPVYRMDKAASWAQMRSVVGIVNYLNVRVTNDNVTISKPDGIEAKISVTNPFEIVGNLYQQKKGRFKVSLKNTSKVEFCAPISIYIQEKSSTKREYSATEGITLQPNETIDMNLTSPLNYTPGDYLIYLVVEGNNETQDLATIEAKILSPPTEPYQLIITQAPTSTKTSIYSGEEMNLTAKIKNEGGYYDGAVGIVYVRVNNENSKKMFKYQDLILDKNEETIITLNDYVELLPSEYNACIYTYDNKKKTWFGLNPIELNKYTFTVIEGSGIDSPNYSELSIYPNPATNKLNVRADDNVKFIRITNLTGKTMITLSPSQEEKEISISIDELNAGTYLIQIITDNGIRTNKFIKQN